MQNRLVYVCVCVCVCVFTDVSTAALYETHSHNITVHTCTHNIDLTPTSLTPLAMNQTMMMRRGNI